VLAACSSDTGAATTTSAAFDRPSISELGGLTASSERPLGSTRHPVA
jgi:hypothetical protein